MSLKAFTEYLVYSGVLLTLGNLALVVEGIPQQVGTDPTTDTLNRYGYVNIGREKYATVVFYPRTITWFGAYTNCRSHIPGASLFIVDSAQDSAWLGKRINFEKERVNGASKFWLGLSSRSPRGSFLWLNGQPYRNYPEVIQVSGYDDSTKKYAWAVPDGLVSRMKYEFLTSEDEAEAYVCQYVKT